MCVFIFSTTFICNISHSRKNSARYFHKYEYFFKLNTSWSCRILMKLRLYRKFFEKTQIPHFIRIRSVAAELFAMDRRTDRATWQS
jgi:hypothetical protein